MLPTIKELKFRHTEKIIPKNGEYDLSKIIADNPNKWQFIDGEFYLIKPDESKKENPPKCHLFTTVCTDIQNECLNSGKLTQTCIDHLIANFGDIDMTNIVTRENLSGLDPDEAWVILHLFRFRPIITYPNGVETAIYNPQTVNEWMKSQKYSK
jgi:hypothetical protein